MTKIQMNKTNKLIFTFIIKIILTTIAFLGALSALFSLFVYKMDLDLIFCDYFSLIVTTVSSYFVAKISISSFKNNRIVFSMISVFPLLIIIVTNYFISGYSIIIFLLKIVLVIAFAFLATIKIKKNRYKV